MRRPTLLLEKLAMMKNTLGGPGRPIAWGQQFETNLANMAKPHVFSEVWWYTPVIPDTQEAEARESPEPRRRKLQAKRALLGALTLRPEFLRMRSRPIHMSVSSIWLHVLEYSGIITAHFSLDPLGSRDPPTSAS
ncbi:hypothetical protein AAY473_023753 [Plecturocebus cupreus]